MNKGVRLERRHIQSAWPQVAPPTAGAPALQLPHGLALPRISIVTPNYNYGALIERTMQSVLQQSYPDLEYVVIDDGSTDQSVEIIQRHQSQLKYWTHRPNRGQYESVNEGFTHTTGEVMAWLDSDDVYLPWTLWCVGAIFAHFPEVHWLVGQSVVMQDGVIHRVRDLKPFPQALIRAGLFHGGPGGLGWISQENMFWRRSLWNKAGPLRTSLRVGADYDMNIRFAQHAELYVASTVLGGFNMRFGQNRSTVEWSGYMQDIQKVLGEGAAAGPKSRVPKRVRLYQRVRRLRGVRGIVRHALRLSRFQGPLLWWNFRTGAYDVRRVPYFR